VQVCPEVLHGSLLMCESLNIVAIFAQCRLVLEVNAHGGGSSTFFRGEGTNRAADRGSVASSSASEEGGKSGVLKRMAVRPIRFSKQVGHAALTLSLC